MKSCENCQKAGLPILLARYTAVPKNMDVPLPDGITGDQVSSVALQEHNYALRLLRSGYVYLFYDKGPRGSHYWEVYRVAENGSLWRATLPLPDVRQRGPSCDVHKSLNAVKVIAIASPELCGDVYIAFSEHAWSEKTLARYATDASLRQKRMQMIRPANWTGAPQGGHAVKLDASVLTQSVVEYLPWKQAFPLSFQARSRVCTDLKTGKYNAQEVAREFTRYPLNLQSHNPDILEKLHAESAVLQQSSVSFESWFTSLFSEDKETAYGYGVLKEASPAESLVMEMDSFGEGIHPPMLLALWDAVGTTHELNGFRNDAVGAIKRYTEEAALQVSALSDIEQAKALIKSNCVKSADEGAEDEFANSRFFVLQQKAAAAKVNMSWLPHAERETAKVMLKQCDYLLAHTEIDRRLTKFDRNLKTEADYERWQAKMDAEVAARKAQISAYKERAWDRYAAHLNQDAIESFQQAIANLQSEVDALQDDRASDVGAWVNAPLLLVTLEDYDATERHEGMAFEDVIAEAIFGLASTPKGKTIVDTLVSNIKASDPTSLVWRAVALNMDAPRAELEQALATAKADKSKLLDDHASAVVAVAGQLSAFTGMFIAIDGELEKAVGSDLDGTLLRRSGIDRLMTGAGNSIFELFHLKRLESAVGEKILQHIFLVRAGVTKQQALHLVEVQARTENLSRRQTLARLERAKTLLSAEPSAGSAELAQAWKQIGETPEDSHLLRSGRLAALLAVIEIFHFYKLCGDAQDDDIKQQLLISGLTLGSALAQLTYSFYDAALKKLSTSGKAYEDALGTAYRLQGFKLAAGSLGSVALIIDSVSKIKGGVSTVISGNWTKGGAVAALGFAGVSSGGAILATSLRDASPLIIRLAERVGLKVIATSVVGTAAFFAGLRFVAFLAGWQVAVALVVAQGLFYLIFPNDLEEWCMACPFAKEPVEPSYTQADKQQQAFEKALHAVV